MKNKLIILAALSSFNLFAQDTGVVTSDVPEKPFNHRESHWLIGFGFETLKYNVPLTFVGEKEELKEKDEPLYGARLSFGREFYLGGGVLTTTTAEAYYVGTLFEKARDAEPDISDSQYTATKKTGQVFGFEAIQNLGFMFNLKTKNPFLGDMTYLMINPYVEAGIGFAKGYQRRTYSYNTTIVESYKQQFSDDILSQRVGLGVNITSNEGFFFYEGLCSEFRNNSAKIHRL